MQATRIAFCIALGCASLWAQATSQIQGIITDASGAAVPGAEVKATQTDTGAVRTVISGTDGNYVLANLPIGPYKLEVSKQGFNAYVQTGIVLQVASNPTVDVALKVGAVTEQVQVEANAALVDVESTSVGSVIENKRILELPLNGRNPVELIQLAGAAIPAGKNGTAGFPGGLNISIAGGSLSGVTYFLDGNMFNNPFDAVNFPFPFPDALQEFKVETSNLTAQNGMHSAAAVSAVVKSGTNAFHGDAFDFFRNGHLNARNFFASQRDTLKRNQFGATVGGPILKNRLFFFAGYQGTRLRSDPVDLTAFVPTPQMLAGDFSGCSTFPNTIIDPLNGQAFPGKQIPTTRFSAPSLAITKLLPKSTNACGQTTYGPIQDVNDNQVVARVDYMINERQQLFGRYMATKYVQPPSYSLSGNILDSTSGGLDDLAQAVSIGHTFLYTPTTVNTLRLAYNRIGVFRDNNDYFSPCDIGVANFTCFVPHQTVVGVTGGFAIGIGTAIAASFIPSYYTISDDVTLVRGNHQIAAGVSAWHYQHSQSANVYSSATFTFNGLGAGANLGTGLNMADFLLGRVGSMTQGLPNTVFTTKWYYGLYLQDTWKASRRLTVNAGVRYEPFLPQRVNNGAVYNYSPQNFVAGVESTVFPKAPAGLTYAGDPGFEGKTGVKNRYDQFAPRLGLSYDLKGDGKTVLRASFGISYDFPNTQIMSTPATAPPFGNALTGLAGPFNFANPWSTFPGGNPFPGTPGTFVPFASFMAMNPDSKATTVYSRNFGIQHQIGGSWLVSANYVGTETAHLWVTRQLNPALLVPSTFALGTCPAGVTAGCNSTSNTNQRRFAYLVNPATSQGGGLSFVDQVETGGTVNYNGLLLATQKRMGKGVSLNANYTWSHCIGDITQASTVLGTGGGLNNPNDRRYDRGNCQTPTLDGTQALDRRHILNLTAVLETPRFEQRTLRMVGTGWTLSSSYRVLSGAYQTILTGVDRALDGQPGTQRPNQLLQNPLCANPSAGSNSCWINPAAFAQPAFGTLGNVGRSSVPGPGFFSIDMALSRSFRLREGMAIDLRGEAFNLTNSFRANLAGLSTTLTSTSFGKILQAQDPRIVQLAAKFTF